MEKISKDTVSLINSLYEQLKSIEEVAGLLELSSATVKRVIMGSQPRRSISHLNNKMTDQEKAQIEATFRFLQERGERVTLSKIRQQSNLMHKSIGTIWDTMKAMNLGYPLKSRKEKVPIKKIRGAVTNQLQTPNTNGHYGGTNQQQAATTNQSLLSNADLAAVNKPPIEKIEISQGRIVRHPISKSGMPQAKNYFTPAKAQLQIPNAKGRPAKTSKSLIRKPVTKPLIEKILSDIKYSVGKNDLPVTVNQPPDMKKELPMIVAKPSIDKSEQPTAQQGKTNSHNEQTHPGDISGQSTTILSTNSCSEREKDILNMSVNDVIEIILEKDEILGKRQDIFRENEIDGKSFMLLDQECMSKDLGLKLGPILKIKHLQEEFANKRSSAQG